MAVNEVKMQMAKAKGLSEADAVKSTMKMSKGDTLVDMKRSKREKSKDNAPMREDYPYGLRIDFDDEMMTKLGMDLPEVGSEVKLAAEGTVERAEVRDSTYGGKSKSCCIQLKKMKVG